MATLDPFEVLKRLGAVPLDPLVDVLRQLHRHGVSDSRDLRALLGSREDTRAVSPPPSPPASETRPPDYEAARRHFVKHAQKLREQAMLAERLLDGLTGGSEPANSASLHQELTVPCVPGATARGRFVVLNSLKRAVEVRFRPGRVHGVSRAQAGSIRLAFTPEQPRLEPGESRIAEVLVAVENDDQLPDVLDVGVDVFGDEQLLLKLWLRIEVRGGG